MTTRDKFEYLLSKDTYNEFLGEVLESMREREFISDDQFTKMVWMYEGGCGLNNKYRNNDILIINILYKILKKHESTKLNLDK